MSNKMLDLDNMTGDQLLSYYNELAPYARDDAEWPRQKSKFRSKEKAKNVISELRHWLGSSTVNRIEVLWMADVNNTFPAAVEYRAFAEGLRDRVISGLKERGMKEVGGRMTYDASNPPDKLPQQDEVWQMAPGSQTQFLTQAVETMGDSTGIEVPIATPDGVFNVKRQPRPLLRQLMVDTDCEIGFHALLTSWFYHTGYLKMTSSLESYAAALASLGLSTQKTQTEVIGS